LLAWAGSLRERVEARAPGSWVVVDEVQRLPGLLNEVHDLIFRHGDAYKFALSGSSARKLRRLDVHLLAGRVIERSMFPLVARELGSDFNLDAALRFGSLPGICSDERYRVEKLRAYVHTYLRQEIQQEALVKDLGSFHRFLKVAALMHGQVVNQAGIARDAAVVRTTAQRFFETLDFIWVKGSKRVAIEAKNSRTWRPEYARTINEFLDAGRLTRGFVVYRGQERYQSGRVDALPVEDFLSPLYTDAFYGASPRPQLGSADS